MTKRSVALRLLSAFILDQAGYALTASLGRQPIQRVIALAHRAHLAGEGEGGVGVLCATVRVNVRNVDLHRGVVF